MVGNPEDQFSHNKAQMIIVTAVDQDYTAVNGLGRQQVCACIVDSTAKTNGDSKADTQFF